MTQNTPLRLSLPILPVGREPVSMGGSGIRNGALLVVTSTPFAFVLRQITREGLSWAKLGQRAKPCFGFYFPCLLPALSGFSSYPAFTINGRPGETLQFVLVVARLLTFEQSTRQFIYLLPRPVHGRKRGAGRRWHFSALTAGDEFRTIPQKNPIKVTTRGITFHFRRRHLSTYRPI